MTHKYLLAVSEIKADTVIDLSRLPEPLIEYSRRFSAQRQTEFLACRALLAQLLHQHFTIDQLPELTTTNNARPIFINPQLPDFNISHSENKIAVAIATKGKVGVDIEVCRERKRWLDLAKYTFSADEVTWLKQQPVLKQPDAFWYLWTTRESILKLAGKGVWQMKSIIFTPESKQSNQGSLAPIYHWNQKINDTFVALSGDQPIDNVALYQAELSPLMRLIPVHTNTNIHF